MSLTLNVGDVTYREREVDEVSTLCGAVKAFSWSGNGARGLVVTKLTGPAVCTCHVTICQHVRDMKGFENDKLWDVPPRPAA